MERETLSSAIREDPVEHGPEAAEDLPDRQDIPESFYPYVQSRHNRVHRVLVGNPEAPRRWITQCGGRFGYSTITAPAFSLPTYYKGMCGRCFRDERVGARNAALKSVAEVGRASASGV